MICTIHNIYMYMYIPLKVQRPQKARSQPRGPEKVLRRESRGISSRVNLSNAEKPQQQVYVVIKSSKKPYDRLRHQNALLTLAHALLKFPRFFLGSPRFFLRSPRFFLRSPRFFLRSPSVFLRSYIDTAHACSRLLTAGHV